MNANSQANGLFSHDGAPPVNGGPPSPLHDEGSRQQLYPRLYAFTVLTVILIVLCGLLAFPFLPAITWSVALAIMAWPIHRWIGHRIENPPVAALLSCAAVIFLIMVPGIFVSYQLASEANRIAQQAEMEAGKSTLRQKMAETAGLDQVLMWMDRLDLNVEAEVRKLVGYYTRDAASLAQGSVAAAIQFLVTIFILYYLFLDRGIFLHRLRDLLPLSRADCDKVCGRAADSVHANLYATTITSIIDATGGALLFWAIGLPAPLLWGVVMFVLSLLPVVGAAMVWIPAVAFLALTDRWLGALALLSWGIASFIIVDNLMYVRLAGERMRMHPVPALIAFLGGLAIFGLSGVILGPAIFAVTVAFLEVWKRRISPDVEANPAVVPEHEADPLHPVARIFK